MRRSFRVLLFLFLTLAPAIGAVPFAGDRDAGAVQATGTIEVHARMCDEVPVDGDWFGACHDDLAAGVWFDAVNTTTMDTVSGTTGANGNVTFTLSPGTWRISGPPGDFMEEVFIYCSYGENSARVDHPVALGAGDAVICDYYFVPEDMSGLATIEVHARMCDEVPADGDWFGACHDDVAPNVLFDVMSVTSNEIAATASTGANGNVTFQVTAGTWVISGPPGDFMEATFIYCSTGHDANELPYPLVLASGDSVVCDYYFVPEQMGPTATVVPTVAATVAPTVVPPTPAPTAVPRMPILELPVVIVAGTCADVTSATEIVAELSDAVVLEGDAEGSAEAIQAATSYTLVQIPLGTMLGADHVLAVLDEDGQTVLACGAIGGVPDGQGAFTVGLAPVDESGVAGTAYLATRAGNATGISIFVVPDGLMPEPILEPVG
jgi:hypothetical protein